MLRSIIPVTSLLLATFLTLAGSGLTGILLPLRAGLEGWSPVVIGWMGFTYSLAFLTGCVVIPRLVRRVGHVRVHAVVVALLSMALMAHSLLVNIPSWLIFRAIAGFALAGVYMVIESWLNEQTANENRGLVFSAYMVTNSGGLMVGQFLMIAGDPGTTTLFIVAAMLYASAVIPTGLTGAVSPKPLQEVKIDLKSLFQTSPVAFVGAIATGYTFGTWNFHAPVFGALSGLTDAQIATMLVASMIGGTVMQFPLGRASDKTDRRYIMLFSAVVGGAISIAYLLLGSRDVTSLLVLMLLLGCVLMPLYSIVVAHANDHAKPGAFVETSSGLLILYGIGSMVGPVVAGFLLQQIGPAGFFGNLLFGYVVFGAYTVWRMRRRGAYTGERETFTATPLGRSQTQEVLQLDPRSDDTSPAG